MTTLAGNGSDAFVDGPAASASFAFPTGIVIDAQGDIFVSDSGNQRIRKIDTMGNVTTLAGGSGTTVNDTFRDGTGGPNGTALFDDPEGLAVDAAGNVYVADTGNDRIRKIDTMGNVTTLAGNGAGAGVSSGAFADGTGGPNGTAEFNQPVGVAVDSQGNVFVADSGNGAVRKVDPAGNVTTLVSGRQLFPELFAPGDAGVTDDAGDAGMIADAGGAGDAGAASDTGDAGNELPDSGVAFSNSEEFGDLTGIAIDPQGNLLVSETNGSVGAIVRITPAGVVTLVAGALPKPGFRAGFADGPATTAVFARPAGIALDAQGGLFVADTDNDRIRHIDAAGNVTTLAGDGTAGFTDGPGGCTGSARFDEPDGVAVDAQGHVIVADTSNDRIRVITP